ncbi:MULTISPECIES: hypothetical protein [unclassified Streptomyces]|uniref:hypothetical protein n=1 Tax=unclassified Streptomyces TaxID=2593676 RepID=UPI004040F6C0
MNGQSCCRRAEQSTHDGEEYCCGPPIQLLSEPLRVCLEPRGIERVRMAQPPFEQHNGGEEQTGQEQGVQPAVGQFFTDLGKQAVNRDRMVMGTWWWEQVPWECREYDSVASLHLTVSYSSLGFWWYVHPHIPVVWWMQWCAVFVDGRVAADAAGALGVEQVQREFDETTCRSTSEKEPVLMSGGLCDRHSHRGCRRVIRP